MFCTGLQCAHQWNLSPPLSWPHSGILVRNLLNKFMGVGGGGGGYIWLEPDNLAQFGHI